MDSRPTCSSLRSVFKHISFALRPKSSDSREDLKTITRKMNGMKLPKSEKAKIYQKTPNTIGEEMSRLDPFYIPSSSRVNPFLPLFGGNAKVMGNLFWSCFDINNLNVRPVYRKAVSMIGQEPPSLEN